VAIAEAYYGVLLAQEKVRLDRDNILRTKAYYDQVLAQQANQTALPTDVTRRQLDYLNAQTTLDQDEITLRKSQMSLAQRMGLAQEAALPVVADRLESLLADTASITAEVANAWERRVEMQQEMAQYHVYELNTAKYKRQYLPTVSAYGNLFEQHLSNDYNVFKGENWKPYAFVGVQVGVDLFDGFRRKRLANEFALRMRNSETLQERLRLDINYESRITREEMVASLRAVRVARRNYDLAKQLVEVDKVRVQEGTLTPAELQNTEYAVMQAQNGLLGSLYNFLVARLRWQKATGQLG
jgi:outer membrane protein TolC